MTKQEEQEQYLAGIEAKKLHAYKKKIDPFLNRKNSLASKLRVGLGLKGGELISDKLPEQLKKVSKQILPYVPKHSPSAPAHLLSREKEAEALARVMLGDSHAKVASKLNIAQGHIYALMARIFPDRRFADEILEDVLLSNAHLASGIFAQKADELSAKDAAVSAGIFSQRYIEKKAEREARDNPVTPVHLVLELSSTLKRIQGKVIDADTKPSNSESA
jgi:hypothetical protein